MCKNCTCDQNRLIQYCLVSISERNPSDPASDKFSSDQGPRKYIKLCTAVLLTQFNSISFVVGRSLLTKVRPPHRSRAKEFGNISSYQSRGGWKYF